MRAVCARWVLVACLVAAGLPAAVRAAEDEPVAGLDRKELDQRIKGLLARVINRGADLYNGGNPTACAYLYEGTLMTLQPMLDHRPDLQKAVAAGLKRAASQEWVNERAFAMRAVIDEVYKTVQTPIPPWPAPAPPPAPAKTLWDRLGGEKGVTKVVDEFMQAAVADKKVNFFRDGTRKLGDAELAQVKRGFVELASTVSEGPLKYSGPRMLEVHKGMGITPDEFDALVADLKAALEKNGVKPADVSDVLKAVEGTRKDIVEAKTLWDRLGGEKGVTKIVDEFMQAAVADNRVKFFRDGTRKLGDAQLARVKRGFVELASTVSEGPLKYDGPTMLEVHKGMNITAAEFDALAADLKIALEKNGVKPADVSDVLKAVEGTRKDIVGK
jgi:hemoglobin